MSDKELRVRKKSTTIILSPTILERVDATAERKGLSRSSFLETFLRATLEQAEEV